MTAPERTRGKALRPIAGATLLVLLAMSIALWIERDAAEHDALEELSPASPIAAPPLSASAPDVPRDRPVKGLADASRLPASVPGDALGPDEGYFAGVPRAWTAPFTLSGRVVDAHGAPFTGAVVRYKPNALSWTIVERATGERQRDYPATATDGEGRFTLRTHRGRATSSLPEFSRDHESACVIVNDPRCAELVSATRVRSSGRTSARSSCLRDRC
jgi:hypothetical protein